MFPGSLLVASPDPLVSLDEVTPRCRWLTVLQLQQVLSDVPLVALGFLAFGLLTFVLSMGRLDG